MTSQTLLAVFLLALGGAAIAVQAPINAGLARGIGSAAGAAAVAFGVGFVAVRLLTVVTGGAGGFAKLAGVPVWQLAGGLLGAYYVWSVITGIPTLGVVTAIAAMILGQIVAALALDATGAFGLPVQPLSPTRVTAAGLVAAGLVLSRF